MKEFKNQKEYLYDDNYFEIEEKFVNSDEVYNEDDYYDFNKLNLLDNNNITVEEDIVNSENDLIIIEKLDVEKYKLDFIKKFISIFPNIYTEEEIKIILDRNLKKIVKVKETASKHVGEYCYQTKTINLKIENDRILFHEFIHALRGDETIENIDIFNGIFEGFTKYCENMYMYKKYKKNDFEYKTGEHIYMFNLYKEEFKKHLIGYDILANIIQELSLLYSMINKEESLLEIYLKNKNIYSKINQIYDTYYNRIAEIQGIDKEEYDIKLDSMRYTYYIIGLINEIYELIIDKKDDIRTNYLILEIVTCLEAEFKKIFEFLNINDKNNMNSKNFNGLLLTTSVMNKEQRLLKIIFGEEKQVYSSFEEEMDNIHNTFIKRG